MIGSNAKFQYSLPMTLEQHFKELKETDGISMIELYSLYELLKKRLEEELRTTRNVFTNYSLHDASHSRSIIHVIERFLGEDRIRLLTPTDTFMLLISAYAHDYGMAQSYSRIYETLGSPEFEKFLKECEKDHFALEEEDAQAIKNLLAYLNENKSRAPIEDIYWSIVLAMQLYFRSDHWKGVVNLSKDFQGLFDHHLKGRFICGSEGIVEICMCHGKDFSSIFQLQQLADGIIGDDFHPRFVAAMLRLGDLLDLDNSRFPRWFAREAAQKHSLIPQLSVLHYQKHEAISHLLVTDQKIEIRADCDSPANGFETADLVSQWTGWLQTECLNLRIHWDEIAPTGFGRPPRDPDIHIYVRGKSFRSTNKKMQMQMSQERVMNLLEGTSIYRDKYVGIREVLQNAIDASLLKFWEDVKQNVYLKYKLSKDVAKDGLKLVDFAQKGWNIIFANYDILVEVIKDLEINKILIVVKDKGIGISLEDIEYIADIGSSKENNLHIRKIMEKMPDWLKPSGIFGIGLQSVFQLTDCIEFYTRQPNQPERLISLYSYGKSKGKIDVRDIPPNEDGMFYDNTAQGTNVKIAIDPQKMMNSGKGNKHQTAFRYYDIEFDCGEEIDIVYAEICQVCKAIIKSEKSDYFNISYQEITREKSGKDVKKKPICLRRSFFIPDTNSKPVRLHSLASGESLLPLIASKGNPYYFIDNAAYYWDEKLCRYYYLRVRPCEIKTKENQKQIFLPETVQSLYHVSYKFSKISNVEAIYHLENRSRSFHAGFLDWSILLLDGDVTRYLNIDRDCLKEGAISEEELLQVSGPLLQKWCAHLCELDSKKPSQNRFKDMPGTLLSLSLLFYQNVPTNQFQQFIGHYLPYLDSINLTVGTEHIPITYFWDHEKLFQAQLPLPQYFKQFDTNIPEIETKSITPETLRHFPRRLVQIESIYIGTDGSQIYRLRFGPEKSLSSIAMGEAARLFDYMQAFDPHDSNHQSTEFTSIQKKVFKPDQKYSHLAIQYYPHTFSRGRNFAPPLDNCIRWCILSPFDIEAGKMIYKSCKEERDVCQELLESVRRSTRFKKCVQYILRKRYANTLNLEQIEKSIVEEYEQFIVNMYNLLYKNRSLVKEQFQLR